MTAITSKFSDEILKRLLKVFPERVGLHEPCFEGNENLYVKECIDTGWVSSVGGFVNRFEKELASYTGVISAVAVVNGTSALHLCLIASGVKPGDEVLVPALTFIATANAVHYCHATPHFVDSNEITLGVDPHKLAEYLNSICELRDGVCYNTLTNKRIKACLATHIFGHPLEIDKLQVICEQWHIILIEDAAESLGSFYKGKHTGNFGLLAALSFNGNKTITTGGGGAVLTNDEVLGQKIKHLSTTAKKTHPYEYIHDEVGFNYRLPNINAALGCAQLEQLPVFLGNKRNLFESYQQLFVDFDGLEVVTEPIHAQSNYWLQAIKLEPSQSKYHDTILEQTNAAQIMTRPVWRLLSSLEIYKNCPRMNLDVAKSLEKRLINLPSSSFLMFKK